MTGRRGATLGQIAVLIGLCAVPARGELSPTPQILYTLTSIDTAPTKEELESVLGNPTPPEALTALVQYANGTNIDFGMRLRAIRAIPHFCAGQLDECRSAIIAALGGTATTPGQQILRQRAAIEALGAARTGNPEDVALLVGFLKDGSRDIRVAAVRALRDLCDPAAIGPLELHRDEVKQVQMAITEALTVLQQCGP
jgi:HEAT repeat protein